MIFTLLITIVFIAELIITLAVMIALLRLDKKVLEADSTLELLKPELKEVCKLVKNSSSQVRELSIRFVEKVKEHNDNLWTAQFVKLLSGILLWKLNIKFIKKFRKSKVAKTLSRGLSLLQLVV